MAALETVYATHNFEAENEDEITIKAGEPVIVLEKDEKYQDGWWQGRNEQGQIGLFPVNYTSPTAPENPSLESKIDSLEYAISNMQVGVDVKATPTPSKKIGSISKSNMQKAVSATLSMPQLQGTTPEDWSVDQVSLWLENVGFGDLCAHFKAQDITGDVLLELSLDSLKELDVNTFGKRFKLHNAIRALQKEITQRDQVEQEIVPPRPSIDSQRTNRSAKHSVRLEHFPKIPHSTNDCPHSLSSAGSSSPRYAFSDTGADSNFDPNVSAAGKRNDINISGSHSIQVESLPNIKSSNSNGETSSYHVRDKSIISRPSNVSDRYWYDDSVANNSTAGPQSNRSSARNSLFRGSFLRSAVKTTTSYNPEEPINRLSRSKTVASAQVVPDMEGWLHKQGDKYKTWNRRWFVLKGSNLFYFKNPKEQRVRGIINLAGYRFSSDASIHPGKYCFRAEHDKERTFCFYTDSKEGMKQWMRALMKATISRDYKAPVLSSSTVPTVSLDVARRMNPRPPYTLLESKNDTARLETIRDTRPFSLTYGHRPAPTMRLSRSESMSSRINGYNSSDHESIRHPYDIGGSIRPAPSHIPFTHPSHAASANAQLSTLYDIPDEEDEDLIDPEREELSQYVPPSPHETENVSNRSSDYIEWVNGYVLKPIQSLGELRTGEPIIELLERLSGKTVRRSVITSGGSDNMRMLDDIVAAFRFMGREGVAVDGSYTIKDIFNGDESKVILMLDAIRQRWPQAVAPSSPPASANSKEKKRNRLTFGEDNDDVY